MLTECPDCAKNQVEYCYFCRNTRQVELIEDYDDGWGGLFDNFDWKAS